MQSELRLLDRHYFQDKYLFPAISAGLLEMTDPEKPAHNRQKYRLTPLGQMTLAGGSASDTPESGLESPTQSPTQSSDPVERLLSALQDGEKSSDELRNSLAIKHRPTFRQNYLHPALQDELIEYTIPDKPQSRLQKYRLTQTGRAWLAAKRHTKQTTRSNEH